MQLTDATLDSNHMLTTSYDTPRHMSQQACASYAVEYSAQHFETEDSGRGEADQAVAMPRAPSRRGWA